LQAGFGNCILGALLLHGSESKPRTSSYQGYETDRIIKFPPIDGRILRPSTTTTLIGHKTTGLTQRTLAN
jgi:hypothetical protein